MNPILTAACLREVLIPFVVQICGCQEQRVPAYWSAAASSASMSMYGMGGVSPRSRW